MCLPLAVCFGNVMDIARKPITGGHVLKLVLGLCLIISALTRPEIGLHIPGYLADMFVGPAYYGVLGLTWTFMMLAGLSLLGAFRGAGFFVALALACNLTPLGSRLSFVAFVPTLLDLFDIRGTTGSAVVHAVNLLLVILIVVVQTATAESRSPRTVEPTRLCLQAMLAIGLLSGVAIALPIGCIVACVLGAIPSAYLSLPVDAVIWLYLGGGTLLVSGLLGAITTWQRLFWIVRVSGNRQEINAKDNVPAGCVLTGIASLGPAFLLSGLATAVPACLSYKVVDTVSEGYRDVFFLLGSVVIIGGVFGVLVSWRRLIARVGHKPQEDDSSPDSIPSSENAASSTQWFVRLWLPTMLLRVISIGVVVAVCVATWKDANDPLRYGRHFDGLIAWADRIVVRQGGSDCCGPVDGQRVLFEVVAPDELAEVRDHLQISPGKPSGGCLCCGFPGVDWYRGKTRIALTSVHHGRNLRWSGFPGDAPLTEESARWLREWLERRGYSEEKLNSLERGQYDDNSTD